MRNIQETETWIRFTLTEQTLKNLEEENIPNEMLKDLKSFIAQEFMTEKELWGTLEERIGKEQLATHKRLILRHVEKKTLSDEKSRHQLFDVLSLFTIGGGVGCLAGLSVSPVISIIITSLIGVVVGLISAMSGLKGEQDKETLFPSRSKWRVSPQPIALVVIGIIIGCGLGIWVRNQNLLGTDLHKAVKRWQDVGMEREVIVKGLFEREMQGAGTTTTTTTAMSVLFGQEEYKACQTLTRLSGAELRTRLKYSSVEVFNDLPDRIQDDTALKITVNILCEKFQELQ